MARYHGRHGAVYGSTTGTGTASLIASLNEWTLDQGTDEVDVTSFGDANKVYVQGLRDIRGTFAGFWDDTESKIYSGADSADGVRLYLYMSSDASGRYFYGPAWLNFSISTGVGDAVKVTGNFMANGAWGRSF